MKSYYQCTLSGLFSLKSMPMVSWFKNCTSIVFSSVGVDRYKNFELECIKSKDLHKDSCMILQIKHKLLQIVQ